VEAYRERYGLFACTAVPFNHESPRRGLDYVTRKITSSAARIKAGLEESLVLGNLDGRRDWSFAGDIVHAMWLMLEQPEPGDFVLASGETHSVRELCELAFGRLGLDYRKHVVVDPRQEREADAVELRGNSAKGRLLRTASARPFLRSRRDVREQLRVPVRPQSEHGRASPREDQENTRARRFVRTSGRFGHREQ